MQRKSIVTKVTEGLPMANVMHVSIKAEDGLDVNHRTMIEVSTHLVQWSPGQFTKECPKLPSPYLNSKFGFLKILMLNN